MCVTLRRRSVAVRVPGPGQAVRAGPGTGGARTVVAGRLERVRPGRRARWAAVSAAYGGGALGTVGALGWGLLRVEAKLARRTIGEPKSAAPLAAGSWGEGRRGRAPLHLTVLGDSSAAGFGCERAEQTPGALLAGFLARELDRRVLLEVLAVVGARTASLDTQVARALARPVDLAVVLIGANDVTHRVPHDAAARDLARAVQTLRAAGAAVVVATCPDLGTVKPLWQPLRAAARVASRRMASAQTVAVVEAGGVTVSLRDLLGPEFGDSPTCGPPTGSTRPRRATPGSPTCCCRRRCRHSGTSSWACAPTATACRTWRSRRPSPPRTPGWWSRRWAARPAPPRSGRAGSPGSSGGRRSPDAACRRAGPRASRPPRPGRPYRRACRATEPGTEHGSVPG